MRDDELDEELRTHLEMEIEEHVQGGVSQADAEAAARRAFGNVTLIKEIRSPCCERTEGGRRLRLRRSISAGDKPSAGAHRLT